MKALAALGLLVVAAECGCVTPVRRTGPRPFQLWRGGDDGLTLRFSEALEHALRTSPELRPTGEKLPGTFTITIPGNLDWKESGGRVRVRYEVVFDDESGRRLGAARGKCWEDEFPRCASRVLKYAERLSRRTP